MEENTQNQLRQVRKKYLLAMPEKAEKISSLWLKLLSVNWQVDWLVSLQQQAHQLAGTAGAFGFEELGECAREIDVIIFNAVNDDTTSDIDRQKMSALVDKLYALMLQAARYVSNSISNNDDVPAADKPLEESLSKFLIYAVDDDEDFSTMLGLQLRAQGYSVETFLTPEDCMRAMTEKEPSLILMDINFPAGSLAGIEAVSKLRAKEAKQVPVVFMSARGDIVARLRAIRAGGAGYLTKPLDLDELKNVIAQAIPVTTQVKPRVMIIDDDAAMAEHLQILLNSQGFDTAILVKPLQTLQEIQKSKPDIVVIDMHMPTINGIELLQVIRQSTAMAHLPVIILSADNSTALKNNAINNGADAIVIKQEGMPTLQKVINDTLSKFDRRFRALGIATDNDADSGVTAATTDKDAQEILLKAKFFSGASLPVEMLELMYQPVMNVEGKATGICDVAVMLKSGGGEKIPLSKLVSEVEAKHWLWDLDRWLLQQSVDDIIRERHSVYTTNVCIHLSNLTLLKSSIVAVLTEYLERLDTDVLSKLIFVVDENWLIRYPEQALKFCQGMKALECHLLLKNFGNHDDSGKWLEYGKFDFAKLTPRLIKMLRQDTAKQQFLKSLLDKAMAQRCEVIAANIDDAQTLSLLWQTGVRLFQGC